MKHQTLKPLSNNGGGQAARDGFQNERTWAERFRNWKHDALARETLAIMGHSEIVKLDVEEVSANTAKSRLIERHKDTATLRTETQESGTKPDVVDTRKADIVLAVHTKAGIFLERLSLKQTQNGCNFSQTDKRSVDDHALRFGWDNEVTFMVKNMTGETDPTPHIRQKRWPKHALVYSKKGNPWLKLGALDTKDKDKILGAFAGNKERVVETVIAGQGPLKADWLLLHITDENGQTLENRIVSLDRLTAFARTLLVCESFQGTCVKFETAQGETVLSFQRKGGQGNPEFGQFKMCPITLTQHLSGTILTEVSQETITTGHQTEETETRHFIEIFPEMVMKALERTPHGTISKFQITDALAKTFQMTKRTLQKECRAFFEDSLDPVWDMVVGLAHAQGPASQSLWTHNKRMQSVSLTPAARRHVQRLLAR